MTLRIAAGFLDYESILENALMAIKDEQYFDDAEMFEDITEDDVSNFLTTAWKQQLRQQEHWPEITDVDCLKDAFNQLRALGITAEMDFACCTRCGHAEIGEQRQKQDWAYVFFHEQDTDRVIETGKLFLAFGSYSGNNKHVTEAGQKIVQAIQDTDLDPEWDGSTESRICIDMTWQNRLHEDAPN